MTDLVGLLRPKLVIFTNCLKLKRELWWADFPERNFDEKAVYVCSWLHLSRSLEYACTISQW